MTKRKSSASTPVTLVIDPVALLAAHKAERQVWADNDLAGHIGSMFGDGTADGIREDTRRKLAAANHDVTHGRLPAGIAAQIVEFAAADYLGFGGDPATVGDDWVRAFHPRMFWTTVPEAAATWNAAENRYESTWDDPRYNAPDAAS